MFLTALYSYCAILLLSAFILRTDFHCKFVLQKCYNSHSFLTFPWVFKIVVFIEIRIKFSSSCHYFFYIFLKKILSAFPWPCFLCLFLSWKKFQSELRVRCPKVPCTLLTQNLTAAQYKTALNKKLLPCLPHQHDSLLYSTLRLEECLV